MRALRCLGADRVGLVEVSEPEPRPDQVLVRVEASALCGSERSTLRAGQEAAPWNTGHEASGTVVSAPEGSGFSAGERVGVSALAGCGTCTHCEAGRELFCGTLGVQVGLHAELVAVAPQSLRRLPEDTPAGIGALLTGDGLGVPVRAATRVPTGPGDRVLVLGLGPVGLAHVLVRAHLGAEVVAVEPSAYRRDLAVRLGAAAVLTPDDQAPTAPLVIEATGLPTVIANAFDRCESRGTVLQSGECATAELHPSRDIIHREITYLGTWFYAREDYPRMLALHRDGIDLAALMTHDVPVDQAQVAVDDFVAGNSGKVVLRWNGG